MKRTLRTTGAALALALMCCGTAFAAPPAGTTPTAGGETEARSRYARGVELYNDGAYGAALVELERAQALAPHYGILHSIGLVKVQLADFVGALGAFEQYLALAGDDIPSQRKQEISDKITQMRERIGTLEITTTVEGAEILLDENLVGLTPLAKPFRVNPGKHEVTARKPGEKGESKKISVAGGDKVKLAFDFAPVAAPPVAPAPIVAPEAPPPAPAETGMPKWVVGTWIGAAVLAAGATTTGIIGLSRASDLKSKREDGPSNGSALNDLSSEVKTWGTVTDVLAVSAVVLAGVSLYFTLRSGSSAPARARAQAGARTVSTPAVFGLTRTGFGGTF